MIMIEKKEKAQEIVPQVSSLLESVTNGDVFRNINTMQQAAPISQELKAYGVDVSKGEKLNVQYTGSGTEKAALFCSILTDLAKAQDYKKQNR